MGSSAGDQGNLRTVTGSVSKVDSEQHHLDQGVTLTVDSQTQVLRRWPAVGSRDRRDPRGTQVRASFDPIQRADKNRGDVQQESKKARAPWL